MNPWELLAQKGSPSFEDIQSSEAQTGAPGTVNLWAGIPDQNQVDPSGAPSLRGKTMKFEGHWERSPNGMSHFVKDKVWYEENK